MDVDPGINSTTVEPFIVEHADQDIPDAVLHESLENSTVTA